MIVRCRICDFKNHYNPQFTTEEPTCLNCKEWLKGSQSEGPSKHVIILGAGASLESGYPLARDLRLLMTSPVHLRDWLGKHCADKVPMDSVNAALAPFADTLNLFRDGAFSSVDEFGMIARNQMQKEVQQLKRLMSFVLGVVNPSNAFDSPYYRLANALFERDSMTLRKDISILTLNYDPHLEYTIARARAVRIQAANDKGQGFVPRAFLLSGFTNEQPSSWEGTNGFFIGKLHGTIAIDAADIAQNGALTFNVVMRSPGLQRYSQIGSLTLQNSIVPAVFPWELFAENGEIRTEQSCAWNCDLPGIGSLHSIMQNVWKRATEEIRNADTISFVGISMHHYLEPGLKRLFARKRGQVKLVIANPDIKSMDPSGYARGDFHPRCSYQKIRTFLQSAAPDMEVMNSPHYLSFDEFIAGEIIR